MKTLMKKKEFRKMALLLLPAIAGVAIALQTAFSGKLNRQIGSLETVIAIHFFGLLLAVIIYLFQEQSNFGFVAKTNLLPIMAGSLGVIIIFTISKSFIENGALTTVLISVVIQLVVSKMIDHFGFFGVEKNPINLTQVIALAIVIGGIVLYQIGEQ